VRVISVADPQRAGAKRSTQPRLGVSGHGRVLCTKTAGTLMPLPQLYRHMLILTGLIQRDEAQSTGTQQ
jgi:hypothetical protein